MEDGTCQGARRLKQTCTSVRSLRQRSQRPWPTTVAAGAGSPRARARACRRRAPGVRAAAGNRCPRAGSERGQHRSGCQQRLAEVSAGRACRGGRLGGGEAALSGRSVLGTAGPSSRAQGSSSRLWLLGGAPHQGELPRPGPRPPRRSGALAGLSGLGDKAPGNPGRLEGLPCAWLASPPPGSLLPCLGRCKPGGVGLAVTVAKEKLGIVSARWWTLSRPRGTHIPGGKGRWSPG